MQALAVVPTLAQTGGGSLGGLVPLLLIVGAFYLLLIRPQQSRAKQHRALIASLSAGDRVVTIGGLHGTIHRIDEDTVRLELAPGTVVTMARAAIARTVADADAGAPSDSAAPSDQ
ncbi:MAG: preprotein translocase subunit YajC [Actinomycetota bacterium]|nr:preprotein translocase subunit YajC [Actinomycetota bacterium]